jgi:DMSO/TMAO reductase YedYZ molybdopterin-dependent catalytic subunit
MASETRMCLRRQFLSRMAVFPYTLALQAAGFGQNNELRGADTDLSSLSSLVTPNSRFFIRNHFPVPVVSVDDWKLTVTGRLGSPREITFRDILQLPNRHLTVTVECAGNGVGGGAVSTATWAGVPLRELLSPAGLEPGVRFIRLTGGDRGGIETGTQQIPFARSIPLDKAMHPDTLLAFEMNGAPLSGEHGYPVRTVVPGWYGMDSVKWLVAIEALDHEDLSHFMTERYVASHLLAVGTRRQPISRMRVKSQITTPREGERLPLRTAVIRGATWAGESKVSTVEVSVTEGKVWVTAELEGTPQPYAWVFWKCVWTPPVSGKYTIVARATDAEGRTQPVSKDWLRFDQYENNWYHTVRCEVL